MQLVNENMQGWPKEMKTANKKMKSGNKIMQWVNDNMDDLRKK